MKKIKKKKLLLICKIILSLSILGMIYIVGQIFL